MPILGPTVPISSRQKRVVFQNPGVAVPNGDGGFTNTWTDLPPAADAKIAPASQQSLERVAAGTVVSSASHIVTVPYRAGISTQTRLLVDGRYLSIVSIQDPDERHVELILICTEAVV